MARAIFINGPTLVSVNIPLGSKVAYKELGLTEKDVQINVRSHFYDVQCDDYGNGGPFGGQVPPEVLILPSDVIVKMSLIHFDRDVLDSCMASVGGLNGSIGNLIAAGTPMGLDTGADVYSPTSRRGITLSVSSSVGFGNKPWEFFYAYLMEQPMEFPLGTKKSIVNLTWRAIPGGVSVGDPISQGRQLWRYLPAQTQDQDKP